MALFEKIRTVGKVSHRQHACTCASHMHAPSTWHVHVTWHAHVPQGAYGAAVLYRKKDDNSLVILKEINLMDLSKQERSLALNEVQHGAMCGCGVGVVWV